MSTPSVTVQRTIEFSETDAAGLVHFSNYFRFMESAERVFFQEANVPLFSASPSNPSGFPRVETSCRFTRPLRFGDTIAITLTLEKVRSCSLHFSCRFARCLEQAQTEAVAEGTLTTVYTCVDPASGALKALPLPEAWLSRMGWPPADGSPVDAGDAPGRNAHL